MTRIIEQDTPETLARVVLLETKLAGAVDELRDARAALSALREQGAKVRDGGMAWVRRALAAERGRREFDDLIGRVWLVLGDSRGIGLVEAVREVVERSAAYLDTCELAWGVIANAHGGNWDEASEMWRGAAERWRDRYHDHLRTRSAPVPETPPRVTPEPRATGWRTIAEALGVAAWDARAHLKHIIEGLPENHRARLAHDLLDKARTAAEQSAILLAKSPQVVTPTVLDTTPETPKVAPPTEVIHFCAGFCDTVVQAGQMYCATCAPEAAPRAPEPECRDAKCVNPYRRHDPSKCYTTKAAPRPEIAELVDRAWNRPTNGRPREEVAAEFAALTDRIRGDLAAQEAAPAESERQDLVEEVKDRNTAILAVSQLLPRDADDLTQRHLDHAHEILDRRCALMVSPATPETPKAAPPPRNCGHARDVAGICPVIGCGGPYTAPEAAPRAPESKACTGFMVGGVRMGSHSSGVRLAHNGPCPRHDPCAPTPETAGEARPTPRAPDRPATKGTGQTRGDSRAAGDPRNGEVGGRGMTASGGGIGAREVNGDADTRQRPHSRLLSEVSVDAQSEALFFAGDETTQPNLSSPQISGCRESEHPFIRPVADTWRRLPDIELPGDGPAAALWRELQQGEGE